MNPLQRSIFSSFRRHNTAACVSASVTIQVNKIHLIDGVSNGVPFGKNKYRTRNAALMMSTSSVGDFINTEIKSNKVVVFSKSSCPFCRLTKDSLASLSIDAKIHELDQMDNGFDVQAALLAISGQRTVPNVFVQGKHLGGNDDTQEAIREGTLQDMLK